MADFICINSSGGRIGRFCWINSDLRKSHRSYAVVCGDIGNRAPWLYALGWWGSAYLCSPHPSRPGEAW